MDKLLICLIIFGLLFGMFILPAIWSTITYHTQDSNNLFIGGWYEPSTDKIIILEKNNTFDYKLSFYHELCHRENYKKFLCTGIRKNIFLEEVECYIKEWRALWSK